MLSDEDRAWLKKLNEDLQPSGKQKPRGPLMHDEVYRAFAIIEEAPLLTTLFPYGQICGVGLELWEHETYLGTGPQSLLRIAEEHLPDLKARSWYEHLLENPKVGKRERRGGECDPDAWEIFTKFTHSKRNRAWLTQYGIRMQLDKIYYDY